MGADFARDLRGVSRRRYRALFRTYGPRSFLYAEMVFGNALNITKLSAETPQSRIFAMRAPRSHSALPRSPSALACRWMRSSDSIPPWSGGCPPARTCTYRSTSAEFGPDVSFWHRPANPAYASVLNEFVRLNADVAAVA